MKSPKTNVIRSLEQSSEGVVTALIVFNFFTLMPFLSVPSAFYFELRLCVAAAELCSV